MLKVGDRVIFVNMYEGRKVRAVGTISSIYNGRGERGTFSYKVKFDGHDLETCPAYACEVTPVWSEAEVWDV